MGQFPQWLAIPIAYSCIKIPPTKIVTKIDLVRGELVDVVDLLARSHAGLRSPVGLGITRKLAK